MTKKDFELIAGLLKANTDKMGNSTFKWFCDDLAEGFKQLYPRFDKEKFLQACGVEIESHICQHNNAKACCATCKYIETNR